MALSIVCPGCDADYSVPDNLLGKSIRCKKCGETIDVKARPKARVSRDDDDDDRPRKAAPRRRDDDEDYENTPSKKGVSPVLIGGLAALLLGAGAAGAYFLFSSETTVDKPQPIAQRPDPEKTPQTTLEGGPLDPTKAEKTDPVKPVTPVVGEKVKPVDDKKPDSKLDEKKTETKAVEKKPEEKKPEEKKPEEKKPEDKKPAPGTGIAPPTPSASQSPGGLMSLRDYLDCNMPGIIQEQVQKSAVLFKVDNGEGSGWFALEPNLVITNAHVLHMLGRNPKEPKKIEIVLNSGTPKERVIPHSSIKILAVDGKIDLALLRISDIEKDLPPPLKVKRSNELQLSQKLRVFGFPLGSSVSDESFVVKKTNPTMSVRPTTVTALRRDDFGTLQTVQHEGGVTNGNSGGPIVDAEGNVAAVVVRGYVNYGRQEIEQNQASAIASEWVVGLMAGRIDEVIYGEPIKNGDRVKIPVKVKMLDPLKRVNHVGIRHWIGTHSELNVRGPGSTPSPKEPGDTEHKEVKLKYDPETKMATGFLDCDRITAEKTSYWSQPFVSNALNPLHYEGGTVMPVDSLIVEEVEAALFAKPKEGTVRTTTLSNSARLGVVRPGQSERRNAGSRLDEITMKETIVKADAQDTNSVARLRLQYEKFNVKALINSSEIEIESAAAMTEQINKVIKQIEAYGWVNKAGEVYKTKTNALNLTGVTGQSAGNLISISDSVLDSLKIASIPLPNETVQAGHVWKVSSDHTETLFELVKVSSPPKPDDIRKVDVRYVINASYKFIGIRTREGKREAVIEVDGTVNAAKGKSADTAKGTIKGRAIIELDTGTVVENVTDREFEIDISAGGVKRSLVGKEHCKLKRSSPNN